MREVVVFFLSLCLLLLRWHGDACARVRHDSLCFSAALQIEKAKEIKFENISQNFPIVKDNSLNDKKEEFIGVEDDDDDDNLVFARKHFILIKYFITLAYTSLLISFYNYLKNRLPFCRHLSYTSSFKYILQRVLRL